MLSTSAPAPATPASAANPAAGVLTIANVSLALGKNHGLQDFSLTLHRGENIVVLGKSGGGKSVLVKCVIGLLRAPSRCWARPPRCSD